jgi:hypothetical protein
LSLCLHCSDFFVVCGWQDILVIKPPKKSPMLLRTAVFMFSIVSVVFIFSVCRKQIITEARTKFIDLNVIDNLTQSIVKQTHNPSILHYPEPLSFSRYWEELFCSLISVGFHYVLIYPTYYFSGMSVLLILSCSLQYCRIRDRAVGGLRPF